MNHNRFQKPTHSKFGRIPPVSNTNEVLEPTAPAEVKSPFDEVSYNVSFNSAISAAKPIWEVMQMTEEQYFAAYHTSPAEEAKEPAVEGNVE